MKKLTIGLTIAILVSITSFVAFSDYAILEVNTSYGQGYNPPGILSRDCTETDSSGPLSLYSTASTWAGYTDDGYTGKWVYGGNDKNKIPTFSEDTRIWLLLGQIWKIKELKKKFAVSAYAYVSYNSSTPNYKTSYNLHAEVPVGFQYPHKRKPGTQTKYGYFSKFEFRHGAKDGWNYSLNTSTIASASATGFDPNTKGTEETSSEAPTPSTADELIIWCDYCNDSGCSACSSHR